MLVRNLPDRWDMEADVVAIGSGIGGLSAAITAHDEGASAIVLERSGQVGGVTALSQGQVWIPGNHLARELGIEDSSDSGFRYLQRLSMGYGEDQAILNLTVHAREALKYFEEKAGLRMTVIRGCPDYYYGLTNDSDSFVIPNPETIFDLVTNDLTPTFWGRAEANTTVRLFGDAYRDLNGNGVFDFVDINGDGDFDLGIDVAIDTPPNGVFDPNLDVFIGQTTAIPRRGRSSR